MPPAADIVGEASLVFDDCDSDQVFAWESFKVYLLTLATPMVIRKAVGNFMLAVVRLIYHCTGHHIA